LERVCRVDDAVAAEVRDAAAANDRLYRAHVRVRQVRRAERSGEIVLNGERVGFRVEITISGIGVGFCAGHGDDHDLGLGRLEIRVLAFRHDGVPGQQKQTPLSLPRTFLYGRFSSSTPVLGSNYEVKADTDSRLRGQG
jgi:hypothetical protein